MIPPGYFKLLPLCWDSKYIRYCSHSLRVEFFAFYSPLALLFQNQIFWGLSSQCKTVGLGSLKWGLHFREKFGNGDYPPVCGSPSQGVWVLIILKLCLSHPSRCGSFFTSLLAESLFETLQAIPIDGCSVNRWNFHGDKRELRSLLLYHLGHHQQGFRFQSSPNKATVKPPKSILKMSLSRY